MEQSFCGAYLKISILRIIAFANKLNECQKKAKHTVWYREITRAQVLGWYLTGGSFRSYARTRTRTRTHVYMLRVRAYWMLPAFQLFGAFFSSSAPFCFSLRYRTATGIAWLVGRSFILLYIYRIQYMYIHFI